MFVDSHCHLTFPDLAPRLPEIRTAMAQAQVDRALCICTTMEEFEDVHALAATYDNFWATVGVHPDNEGVAEPTVQDLVERGARPRVVAIGETGLDYYQMDERKGGRTVADLQWQRDRFRTHIHAARQARLPLVIHEANASAGIANKVGARWADRVLAAVADCGLPGAQVVGIPVRRSLAGLDRAAMRDKARHYFGLDETAPTLLVFGGSQGALRLNDAVVGAAPALGEAGIGVLHAYGPKNHIEPQSPPGAPAYIGVGYLNRMDLAYAAADLVICRSGAMTVAEVSATGLPAVYVPLPHGNGEQELNALPVVQAGGGLLVPDDEMSPDWVAREVPALLGDPARLAQMAANAAVGGHRDAATRVACAALELAEGHRGGR